MGSVSRWVTCAGMAIVLGGCAQAATPTQPAPTGTVTDVPPAPPPPISNPATPTIARYRVVFESTWSPENHPTDFPAAAHYSRLIGGTHTTAVAFWREGALASEGIRRMAERGAISPLDAEVMDAIAAGVAEHALVGPGLGTSPGNTAMEFEISKAFPLVTLVTMVAPSPDWFVGVSGLALLVNGAWVDELDVPLHAYDAGTDSGTTYTSPDAETTPQGPVARIHDAPLAGSGSDVPLGRFHFTRVP